MNMQKNNCTIIKINVSGGGVRMNREGMELENEEELTNVNPLAALQSIKGFLTTEEELAFMQILFHHLRRFEVGILDFHVRK